jgi:arginase
MKNIKLIEVPSEIGAGTRGASLGVEAIKIAALDFMSIFCALSFGKSGNRKQALV